jgi:hypothetical protein
MRRGAAEVRGSGLGLPSSFPITGMAPERAVLLGASAFADILLTSR